MYCRQSIDTNIQHKNKKNRIHNMWVQLKVQLQDIDIDYKYILVRRIIHSDQNSRGKNIEP